MNASLLLFALVGVAFAQSYSTRSGCPPEGYHAIFAHTDLSHLPANGKYAICQTPEQAAMTQPMTNFDWNPVGPFRLRNSKLLVDNNIKININFPSRLDWERVFVTEFEGDDIDGGTDADWNGIHLEGHYIHDDHHSRIEYGNCGSIDTVRVDGVDDDFDSFSFSNCSSKTSVKGLVTSEGDNGVTFTDSYGIIGYDLTAVGDDADYHSFEIHRSEIALIRPVAYAGPSGTGDGFVVTDGSFVTLCDAFVQASQDYVIGTADVTEAPVAVAVAGLSNSRFPNDLSFGAAGGIVFTLDQCPQKIRTSYDMASWTGFWTQNE